MRSASQRDRLFRPLVTLPPLFHSPSLKFTSAFYSSVVISGMIRHAILPRAPVSACPECSRGANHHSLAGCGGHFTKSRICNLLASFPSIPFPFFTLRTLWRNGRSTTPFDSSASALFLSQRRCRGYDPVENSLVSPANYQLSPVGCGLSCGPTRH